MGTGKFYSVLAHNMKPFDCRSEEQLGLIRQRDSNEWMVESVVDHVGDPKSKSKMDFLVKWVGLDSSFNRWLPWRAIRDNIKLHEYLRKKGKGFEELIPEMLEERES